MNKVEELRSRLEKQLSLANSPEHLWISLIDFIKSEISSYSSNMKKNQMEAIFTAIRGPQEGAVSEKLASLQAILVALAQVNSLTESKETYPKLESELAESKQYVLELENKEADLTQKLERTTEKARTEVRKKLKPVYNFLCQVDRLNADLRDDNQLNVRNNILEAVRNTLHHLEQEGLWPEDIEKPEVKPIEVAHFEGNKINQGPQETSLNKPGNKRKKNNTTTMPSLMGDLLGQEGEISPPNSDMSEGESIKDNPDKTEK